ncbi:MAG: response regulator [Acidimicrobiia bacterium]|nr:response regulator [Acidimicrobiia bacterium]
MPKVLLVADAPWVVNEVRTALAVHDWTIDELSDPREAAGRSVGYNAVIVDMQVDSMGGMAVIRDIRQQTAGGPRPRLVLLLDRSADAFLARRAGADASVVKPVQPYDLRTALGRAPARAAEEE